MERREFLLKLGGGAAIALAAGCVGACSSSTAPTNVDFTLDLSLADYTTLNTKGNYIIKNDIVVAHGTDGNFYAAAVLCSHENEKKVMYDKSKNQYFCTAHGATFNLAGTGTNTNGKGGLTIYKTSLSGTVLRVFS